LNVLNSKPTSLQNISATNFNLTEKTGKLNGPARLSLTSDKLESFTITLSNDAGEKVLVGYDKASTNYFIDRSNSGKVSFEKGFAKRHTAPRFSNKTGMDMTLIIDNASVELFADNGLSVMTEIFFPNSLLSNININSSSDFKIRSLEFNDMKSIWR
jgi:fructan beta-fructosidase